MAQKPVGYSGKTLAEKLGFKPGQRAVVIGGPADYGALLGGAPVGVAIEQRASMKGPKGLYDFAHLFVMDRAALEVQAEKAVALLGDGGALWVSWPKKSSKLFRDLTEDGVREVVLPTGWVDVKVCAVDADWSGLKFLRRRVRR